MCPRIQIFGLIFFFFQAEDGIRDWSVTGVQTCALPICQFLNRRRACLANVVSADRDRVELGRVRSEEHTSELQSLTNLVCRLLLEKKKKTADCRHRQRAAIR